MPPYSTIAGTGHLEQVPHTSKLLHPFSLRRQRPSYGSSNSTTSALYSSSSSSSEHFHHHEQYNTVQETQEYRATQYIRDASKTLDSTLQMLGHLLQTCGGVSPQAITEMMKLPTPFDVLKRAQTYLLCISCPNDTRQALLVLLVQAWESLVRVRQLEQRMVYRKLNSFQLNGGATSTQIRKTQDELTNSSESCTQALVGLWNVQRLVKKKTSTRREVEEEEEKSTTSACA